MKPGENTKWFLHRQLEALEGEERENKYMKR